MLTSKTKKNVTLMEWGEANEGRRDQLQCPYKYVKHSAKKQILNANVFYTDREVESWATNDQHFVKLM